MPKRKYSWPPKEELLAFAQEHARRYIEREGHRPSSSSGPIEGCPGATWSALIQRLRYHLGAVAWPATPRVSAAQDDANLDLLCAFLSRTGHMPRLSRGVSEEEQNLARTYRNLRSRVPEKLVARGLPLPQSPGERARQRWALAEPDRRARAMSGLGWRPVDDESRDRAAVLLDLLHARGWQWEQIATALGVTEPTVRAARQRRGWELPHRLADLESLLEQLPPLRTRSPAATEQQARAFVDRLLVVRDSAGFAEVGRLVGRDAIERFLKRAG